MAGKVSAERVTEPTVLMEDPFEPGLAAAVQAGDFVFLSAVDGDRGADGSLDRDAFGNGPAQARNAYETVVRRLEACGLDTRALVRVEHVTASQDWRLERMALWPEIFGTPTVAVSQGFQGKMVGQNMITVTAVAVRPGLPHRVIAAGPSEGRAARIVEAGPFLFVIGVRGADLLATGETAPEETEDAFSRQVQFAYQNIEYWLDRAGASRDNLVRYDAFIRDVNRAMEHRAMRTEHFGGQMHVASTVVGCPLGGRTDVELSAIAVANREDKHVTYFGGRGDLARCVRAGGLAFASGMLGNRDVSGELRPDCFGKLEAQLDLARERIQASLETVGSSWDQIARLDVYVRDPYRKKAVYDWLRSNCRTSPAIGMYGIELEPTAEVELTAIAVADQS